MALALAIPLFGLNNDYFSALNGKLLNMECETWSIRNMAGSERSTPNNSSGINSIATSVESTPISSRSETPINTWKNQVKVTRSRSRWISSTFEGARVGCRKGKAKRKMIQGKRGRVFSGGECSFSQLVVIKRNAPARPPAPNIEHSSRGCRPSPSAHLFVRRNVIFFVCFFFRTRSRRRKRRSDFA